MKIGLVSIALAAYEALALTTKRVPTLTTLSARWPYGPFVWAWVGWLFIHFAQEATHGPVRDQRRP